MSDITGANDLIRRGDAIEAVYLRICQIGMETDPQVLSIRQAVRDIPAADVRPVVRGKWKSVPHKRARVCSRCEADEPYKFADDDANVYNFCPNCGAKMEEN